MTVGGPGARLELRDHMMERLKEGTAALMKFAKFSVERGTLGSDTKAESGGWKPARAGRQNSMGSCRGMAMAWQWLNIPGGGGPDSISVMSLPTVDLKVVQRKSRCAQALAQLMSCAAPGLP